MLVAFKTPFWNQPEGRLYPKTSDGIEVPDEYREKLPSSAKILSADEAKTVRKEKRKKEAAVPKEPDTLSELAAATPSDFPEV